jgi:hypothetical protein
MILKDAPYTIEKIIVPIKKNRKKNTLIAAILLLSESPPLLTYGHPLANKVKQDVLQKYF